MEYLILDIIKSFSKKSFLIVFIFTVLFLILINCLFYFSPVVFQGYTNQHIVDFTEYILKIQKACGYYFVIVSIPVVFIITLIFWLFIKSSLSKIVKIAEAERAKTEKAQKMAISKKEQNYKKRHNQLQ